MHLHGCVGVSEYSECINIAILQENNHILMLAYPWVVCAVWG